jgi:hypothetical protein
MKEYRSEKKKQGTRETQQNCETKEKKRKKKEKEGDNRR